MWQPPLGRRGVRTDRYTLARHRAKGQPERVESCDRKTGPYQLRNTTDGKPRLVESLTRRELPAARSRAYTA
jgi:hypothetical protein